MTSKPSKYLPIYPFKSGVLFPHQMLPIAAVRPASIAAVEAALSTEEKTLLVVPQLSEDIEDPQFTSLFEVGTLAVVRKMARTDEVLQLVVQGIERVKLTAEGPEEPFLQAKYEPIPPPEDWDPSTEALHREILAGAQSIVDAVNPQAKPWLEQMVQQVESPLNQIFVLCSLITMKVEDEKRLLAAQTAREAMELMHESVSHELKVQQVRSQINEQAQSEMSREQREYLLRKQLRAIQDELGEQDPEQADLEVLKQQLAKIELPVPARKEVDRELSRLERLPISSPEYQTTRSYLELVSELPWNATTRDVIDLERSREILDRDHYGLDKVKQRIIEDLAVMKLNASARSPILCFVGPPGVGKTSLGRSIAESLGREFARESLGGLSDESELRGHRKTYIGAMPGRIIQAMRRAGTRNPVLMLDEIDKLGRDFRGDPAAALLEILDPAQNNEFRDNYLNLPFDLSQVFFIATANSLDTIPAPLLDRIEVLEVSGYSENEKVQIARKYLLPRQLEHSGLNEEQLTVTDDALYAIVRGYTRESGVRSLERQVASVCRKAATQVAMGRTEALTVDADTIREMLGHPKYQFQSARREAEPGVVAGLAWTPVGGDVLYVEAVLLPDQRELALTGQLGDVMRESARTAQSFVRSRWAELNLEKQALECGVHIHVPAGATPKDGPSAGVTMATALASLYSHQPVRLDTAMTGEITLSGLVLPVGGVREKVLAAHRAGMKQVILPAANEGDLDDIPAAIRDELQFTLVKHVEEVLAAAMPSLEKKLLHV